MSKKKILLLSDDLRLPSGVGTVSKHIVLGSLDKFDWVQLGAAVKHPDQGKVFDLSEDARKQSGVEDASVKIYPWSGYGDENILRKLLDDEKPDAILHFTDPRQWLWLYNMEHEIRQNIPIFFYHIWDDLPDPLYNRNYYESCDWIGCISKQTYGIVKRVWGSTEQSQWNQPKDTQVDYVPHGIDTDIYRPIVEGDKDYDLMIEFKKQLFKGKDPNYVLFYNARNIRRKMTSDIIISFRDFLLELPKEERDDCYLVLHTTPVDGNGTDLPRVVKDLLPEFTDNIIFSSDKITQEQINCLYNIADTTILISSNEGFGLSTAESIAAGTPIIVNVTGGMQDHCGFQINVAPEGYNDSYDFLTDEDYVEIGSLHHWREWVGKVTWGEWASPVWPQTRSLVGSPPTPYIYDDRVDNYDVTDTIKEHYILGREERKRRGLVGREWLMNEGGLNAENMCNIFKESMTREIENFEPRKRFELNKI